MQAKDAYAEAVTLEPSDASLQAMWHSAGLFFPTAFSELFPAMRTCQDLLSSKCLSLRGLKVGIFSAEINETKQEAAGTVKYKKSRATLTKAGRDKKAGPKNKTLLSFSEEADEI